MRLYVMRHGDSVNPQVWEGEEVARPLTEEGRAEMREAAQGLRWLDPKIDMVVTSPLTRARETAEPVAQALGVPLLVDPALAPGCELHTLAPLLLSGRSTQGVLIVGHEPDFSELVGTLIAGHSLARVSMKKGACCRLDLPALSKLQHERDVRKLAGRATLRWLLTAPQLARLGAAAPAGMTSAAHEDEDAEEAGAADTLAPAEGESPTASPSDASAGGGGPPPTK
jgi:phosphohistidine phosphatase